MKLPNYGKKVSNSSLGDPKFKQYLGGWIPFMVYTDHAALKTLMKYDNPTPRRAIWMEVLATYFFEIKHRPKKKMGHADYLSRIN